MRYRFETFELDDQKGLLIGPGGNVSLRPQVFRLLALLLEEAPAVVSQDRLIDEIWGTQHLCTTSLPRGICELRNVLGDEARKPRFIETVHRRGYRFVGDLERIREPEASFTDFEVSPASVSEADARWQKGFRAWGTRPSAQQLVTTGFLLIALASTAWLLHRTDSIRSPAGFGSFDQDTATPAARDRSRELQSPFDALESQQWSEMGLGAPPLARDATVDPGLAIERLKAALSREPRSSALLWHLSRAWQEMGRLHEAREAAARALEHSQGLPWQARLMISALGDELDGDWTRAARRYRTLFDRHPQQIGLALTYGRALREGGRLIQARDLVAGWLQGPMIDNPRLHLEQADNCRVLEDYVCMLQAAERATQLTATGGSAWLHARALGAVGLARHRSGSPKPVDSVLRQAESMFQTYGFNSRSTQVAQHLAEVLMDRGELDEARLHAETVIGVSHRLENRKELAWGFFLVGRLRAERGQLEDAQRLFETAVESFVAAGHLKGLASAELALARLQRRRLKSEDALISYQNSLEALAELSLENLAATVQGEKEDLLKSAAIRAVRSP